MRCDGSVSMMHLHPAHKAQTKRSLVSHALDKPPLQMCRGIASCAHNTRSVLAVVRQPHRQEPSHWE